MAAVDGPPRSSLELSIAERNAVALGVPLERLMEEAGRVVAGEIALRFPDPGAHIVVLAGAGNNGGDGSSAVRHLLAAGRSAELWVVPGRSAIRSVPARQALQRLEAAGGKVRDGPPSVADLEGAEVVVDALLGTGQSGELRGPYRDAVAAIRGAKAPILSVDLPTGFGGPDAVRPTWTVTLSAPKLGLNTTSGGTVSVRPIGIPDAAFDRTGPGEYLAYPAATSRGRRTRIAVVGGGPFAGAPALAALAALRAGAERATVYAPEPAAASVRAFSPNLVVVGAGEARLRLPDVPALLDALRVSGVEGVVVGMGLGRHPETLEATQSLLRELVGTIPLVVDADALGALPNSVPSSPAAPVVATPNQGEFEREFGASGLGSAESRLGAAKETARARGVTIVVKGGEDAIAGGERTALSGPHPRSMNVGGSGDVLAGVIGRLLAERVDPVLAARLACQWCGDAGALVAAQRGDGLLATDLIDALPTALVAGIRAAKSV